MDYDVENEASSPIAQGPEKTATVSARIEAGSVMKRYALALYYFYKDQRFVNL